MRDFSKISPAVWGSDRFNKLPSDDARYLFMYLLTCEHQTSAGAFRLKDGYATDDLKWDAPRYHVARRQLVEADLIHFDEAASCILITRWFKHNPPMSESHFIGIERQLERLPSQAIWEAASQAANEAWELVKAAKLAKDIKSGKVAPNASDGQHGAIPERLQTPYMQGKRQ